MSQGPHFILGHILDNLADGYVTCTATPEVWYSNPVVENEWSQNVQQKRVFGTYRDADNSYMVSEDVDTSSFKRQLFEELEASASFPSEDNYPSVTILEGDQITSQAINAASGGVLVLRGALVHIPYDAVFSGLLIVESSNVEIGGGDGPHLTGKMLLMAGEHAFDDALRIAINTGEVTPQAPFELEPRECCPDGVILKSFLMPGIPYREYDLTDWVGENVYDHIDTAGETYSSWRIIMTDDLVDGIQVVHQGNISPQDEGGVLLGLPDEVVFFTSHPIQTTISSMNVACPAGASPCSFSFGGQTTSDPFYFGGAWRVMNPAFANVITVRIDGEIDSEGTLLGPWDFRYISTQEITVYLQISPPRRLRLEIACESSDGSLVWPDEPLAWAGEKPE